MNKNIDLTKILKDCPEGFKLYTPLFGEVELKVIGGNEYPIITTPTEDDCSIAAFTKDGFYYERKDAECILFPSKDQRDWSKFTAPWYKKEKFDPKTFKAFDKVLVRDTHSNPLRCSLFSHIDTDRNLFHYAASGGNYSFCIPFNEETKHLVGTTEEAPEFYRYWKE